VDAVMGTVVAVPFTVVTVPGTVVTVPFTVVDAMTGTVVAVPFTVVTVPGTVVAVPSIVMTTSTVGSAGSAVGGASICRVCTCTQFTGAISPLAPGTGAELVAGTPTLAGYCPVGAPAVGRGTDSESFCTAASAWSTAEAAADFGRGAAAFAAAAASEAAAFAAAALAAVNFAVSAACWLAASTSRWVMPAIRRAGLCAAPDPSVEPAVLVTAPAGRPTATASAAAGPAYLAAPAVVADPLITATIWASDLASDW